MDDIGVGFIHTGMALSIYLFLRELEDALRIIYVADIHGAFDRVKTLLSETVADVYIIAGDLIDIPFYNMSTAINYHELQSYFHGLRVRMQKESMVIEDFVDELLNTPKNSEEIEEKGTKYQRYTIRARRVLQQKYKVLENILSIETEITDICPARQL